MLSLLRWSEKDLNVYLLVSFSIGLCSCWVICVLVEYVMSLLVFLWLVLWSTNIVEMCSKFEDMVCESGSSWYFLMRRGRLVIRLKSDIFVV